MILAVRSSDPAFKSVEFATGINLVIADRTGESTETDTRNGVGKSSLIHIIKFCLGSSSSKKALATVATAVPAAAYTVVVLHRGRRVSLTRGMEGNVILVGGIEEREAVRLGMKTNLFGSGFDADEKQVARMLGPEWFGLTDAESVEQRPTFGTLLNYVARVGPEAYLDVGTTFTGQPVASRNLCLSYLMGLGWEHVSRLARLGDELAEAKRNVGRLAGRDRTPSVLESERDRAVETLDRLVLELASFNVIENYRELRAEADSLTREMQVLRDAAFLERERVARLREELPAEPPEAIENLEALYAEARFYFPEQVRASLQAVREFHLAMERTRRDRFAYDIAELDRAIENKETRLAVLDRKRAELLRTMQAGGALEEHARLQARANELAGTIEYLRRILDDIRVAEDRIADLTAEHGQAIAEALQDHRAHASVRNEAQNLFGRYIDRLYSATGNLAVDFDPKKGTYAFKPHCPREAAEGVASMIVFCFDLMLACLQSRRTPGFLIHDTTLFDSVEERQRAIALDLAREEAERCKFQYITFWNTDAVPSTALNGEVEQYVRLRLDDTPEGSLFGRRFG